MKVSGLSSPVEVLSPVVAGTVAAETRAAWISAQTLSGLMRSSGIHPPPSWLTAKRAPRSPWRPSASACATYPAVYGEAAVPEFLRRHLHRQHFVMNVRCKDEDAVVARLDIGLL